MYLSHEAAVLSSQNTLLLNKQRHIMYISYFIKHRGYSLVYSFVISSANFRENSRTILKCILNKYNGRSWAELFGVRIEKNGGLL